jgi:hypothetical protein
VGLVGEGDGEQVVPRGPKLVLFSGEDRTCRQGDGKEHTEEEDDEEEASPMLSRKTERYSPSHVSIPFVGFVRHPNLFYFPVIMFLSVYVTNVRWLCQQKNAWNVRFFFNK